MTPRGGSRMSSPLLGLRTAHGFPVVLGGQGRSASDVRHSTRVLRDLLFLAAGALLAFGAVWICGGGA